MKMQRQNGIAILTFESAHGKPNTLSSGTIKELDSAITWLDMEHKKAPLKGVLLTGNDHGFGVGADVFEIANASAEELRNLIDTGHKVLGRIRRSPFPWVAVLPPGHCLGGMYEVALACDAIVAHPGAKVGLPEVGLNLIPGLGGTQRLPLRAGLAPAIDLITRGRIVAAGEALTLGMIDAIVPDDMTLPTYGEHFLQNELPHLRRPLNTFSEAEIEASHALTAIKKATGGRDNPRAPFVALEVIIEGAKSHFKFGYELERDKFIELATSREGRAGIRTFTTKTQVERSPIKRVLSLPHIQTVAIAGADGYMGNAILFLSLRAGYTVSGWVPEERLIDVAVTRLMKKYDELVKRGKCDATTRDREIGSVRFTTDFAVFTGQNLIIEAVAESTEVKCTFYQNLGRAVGSSTIVASNSSGKGPDVLVEFFEQGGGSAEQLAGLHFFSPAEHPSRALVEIVAGKYTPKMVLRALHEFSRKIGKTPIMVTGDEVGFLVNAGLMAYISEADQLYREGTSVEAIDRVMGKFFPMGPFTLMDAVGIHTAASLADFMRERDPSTPRLLLQELVAHGRLGATNGGGFYEYADGKPKHVWGNLRELAGSMPNPRQANDDEIFDRCIGALTDRIEELVSSKVVESKEEADLAFILGIGFPAYLGGPLFYKETRLQQRAAVSNAV